MIQNKYVITGVAAVVLLAIGGVGGFLLSRPDTKPETASTALTGTRQATSEASTQQQAAGSLSVSGSSQAANLGQLGQGQGGSTTQGNAAGGGTNSSNSSGSNPVNPATFTEYEKYKDGTSALFGDIAAGNGAELTANKKAAVYYKGWLTNGQLFDQSRAGSDGKLQPFVFTIGAQQVIPGWEQGVIGMKVGGKRLIIVPPSVGYGAAGQGSIPGNSVLVFEVELLAVQ